MRSLDLPAGLTPVGVGEEAAASGWSLANAIASLPWWCEGEEEQGALVMGWAKTHLDAELPPIRATVRLTYSTVAGKLVPTFWNWEGPTLDSRRRLSFQEAGGEFVGRPAPAAMLELSIPHGLQELGPDGRPLEAWHQGLSAERYLDDVLPGLARAALGEIEGVTAILLDDETDFVPAKCLARGTWEAVLADPSLPSVLEQAQLTRAELDRISALPARVAPLDAGWQRWVNVTHNRVAEDLGRMADRIAEVCPKLSRRGPRSVAPVIGLNHYHRVMEFCPSERAGVWHASPLGVGRIPAGGMQVVKNYLFRDATRWDQAARENVPIEPTAWARFDADARRRATAAIASDRPRAVMLQCNPIDPACGDPQEHFTGLGLETMRHAVLASSSWVLVSQRMPPTESKARAAFAEYVQLWQSYLRIILQEVNERMGPRHGWRPGVPRLDGQRWVTPAVIETPARTERAYRVTAAIGDALREQGGDELGVLRGAALSPEFCGAWGRRPEPLPQVPG